MKNILKFVVFSMTLLILLPSFARTDEVYEEAFYRKVQNQLLSKNWEFKRALLQRPGLRKIAVDAIWDLKQTHVSWDFDSTVIDLLANESLDEYELADQIRIIILLSPHGLSSLTKELADLNRKLLIEVQNQSLSTRALLEIAKNDRDLQGTLHDQVIEYAQTLHPELSSKFRAFDGPPFHPLSAALIQELFNTPPANETYKSGKYSKVPRLYMFCRHKRNYACLMLLKDSNNQTILHPGSGEPWSQPSLGYAFGGKPYHDRSGYTPSGVYRIDGVMPSADDQKTFGKFRRMILNFVEKSADEVQYKKFLPPSHHAKSWWKEAVTARDIGRNLLRIHGSGRSNPIPWSTFKPFVATRGCVAQREGEHDGVDYKDQRLLLDQMMTAQGLEAKYANETKISGLLYVVEIDNKEGPVRFSDLTNLGLK